MSDLQRLDEIAAKAEQVKNMIGLTHQAGVSNEQYDAVLYIVSDYLIDIIKLAEGRDGRDRQRKKQISEVTKRVETIQAELESLLDDVQVILNDETKYRDNIPENIHDGDRYEAADHACYELEAAYTALDCAKENLEVVIISLESAVE